MPHPDLWLPLLNIICRARRNQAILLDSDSDGIDSDDEHASVCSSDSNSSMARASAPDSFTAGPGRTTPCITQSNRVTAENVAAADKKRLQKRASSKRIRKASREGAQQTAEGQGSDGLIKASYPATPESGARVGGQGAAAGAAAAVAAPLKGASRRALALLYQRGAILSDSDSDSEEPPAARADKSGLLSAGHVDSAAPVAAPAALPAAAAPVLPPAPKPAVVLVAPPSRGKAAAVRQAVAGAAQAAGRAMAAAQAAGPASRQQGMQVVLPAEGRASSPIVLTPPKRAAFTAVAVDGPRAAAQVPQGQAAAASQWEPAFPGPGGEQPAQQQQQQGGSWADGGWSNVAL
jgi:hypothetical protein